MSADPVSTYVLANPSGIPLDVFLCAAREVHAAANPFGGSIRTAPENPRGQVVSVKFVRHGGRGGTTRYDYWVPADLGPVFAGDRVRVPVKERWQPDPNYAVVTRTFPATHNGAGLTTVLSVHPTTGVTA